MRPDPASPQTVRSGLWAIHGLLAPALRESACSRPTQDEIGQDGIEQILLFEQAREPARANDNRGLPDESVGANLADQLAKHRPVAEVEAGLDALDRRPANELSGPDDFNIGKTGRILFEGFHRRSASRGR